MAVGEEVSVVGLGPLMKLLGQYEGQPLQNAMRRAIRAGAKPFQASLKAVAAERHAPRSFQMVPVKVTTHGGAGRQIEAYVRPRSPLFNILEPGAKRHVITPGEKGFNSYRSSRPYPTKARKTGGRALAGQAGGSVWPSDHSQPGRKRPVDFFSTGPVTHPGLKGRGMLPAAFAMGEPASVDAMANVIFGLTGGNGE